MKLLFTVLTLFVCSIFSIAQKFDYEVSDPYEVIDGHTKTYFHKDDKILSVKIDGETVYIQKWDANSLKEIERNKFENIAEDVHFEKVLRLQDHFYLFYSTWDRQSTTERLFVREIDFESSSFASEPKKVVEVNQKLTNSFPGSAGRLNFFGHITSPVNNNHSKYNLEKSFDQSKLLIQYRLKPEIRNDDKNYDVIGLNLFDQEMNSISAQEIKMPYTEAKMNNIDYTVDSKGNAYILGLVYENDKQEVRDRDGNAIYRIELLRVEPNSDKILKTPFSFDKVFVNDVVLFNKEDNEILGAGFYSSTKRLENTDGLFTFKINDEGELMNLKTYDIPLSVINLYEKKRIRKKNKRRIKKGKKAKFENLVIRDLIVQEDGSLILNSEQHYIERHTQSNGRMGGSGYTYTFHFNDILSAKFTPNGDMAWITKLGKRQTGSSSGIMKAPFTPYTAEMIQGGMSYRYFRNKSKHYYLFLDNVRNLKLKKTETPKGHQDGRGGFFTAYVIDDKSGEVSKENLFDLRDVKGIDVFQFALSRVVQISSTEFVIEVYKKDSEDILIKCKVNV